MTSVRPDPAWQRLNSIEGDPFIAADWNDTFFLHYAVAPEFVRPYLPSALELDLYDGAACLSLVAVTMRRFTRLSRSPFGLFLALLPEQTFLNFRTYVHWGEEPGAFFLWGWLSSPYGFRVPLRLLKLPACFARIRCQHQAGVVSVRATDANDCRLSCDGKLTPGFGPCPPGSLCEFALERYSGFFCKGTSAKIFRAWHPAWSQCAVEVEVREPGLVTNQFPWFKEAKLAGANFAKGFQAVQIGRPHDLRELRRVRRRVRHGLSGFYELP